MMARRRKKQSGGYLRGPSHERGGIAANVGGNEMIELEGGEYIVNAQTVNAVGTQFLDKLNSTQTSYHRGGFKSGQLPGSNYRKGGKVRRKLQRGGRASSGTTSSDAGHVHAYGSDIDGNGNGWTDWAVHPQESRIRHRHRVANWVVQLAQSECYPNCEQMYDVAGAPPHIHVISKNYNVNPNPVTSHPHCSETEQGFECPPGYLAAIMRDGTCNCVWKKQGPGWEH